MMTPLGRHRKATTWLAGATLALLVGCGDSTGPSKHQDYLGKWAMTVDAATGCWPSFGLVLTVETTIEPTGGQINIIGTFALASNPSQTDDLTGFIGDPGTFELRFAPVLAQQPAATFSGAGPSPEQLSGDYTDVQGIISGTPGCHAHAVATHS